MRGNKVIHWAVAAIVVVPAVSAQAQNNCRDFTNNGKFSYYYEYWGEADKVLSRIIKGETLGNKLTAKDLDEASVNLRGAISLRSTSGRGNYGAAGGEYPYHPYLALALVEEMRGKNECVSELLAQESAGSLPPEYRAQLTALNARAVARNEAKSYRDLAKAVGELVARGKVSERGSAKGREIVQLGEQMDAPGNPDLKALNSAIAKGITDLAGIERELVRGYFDIVRAVAPNALGELSLASCPDASATENPQRLRTVIDQVDGCLAAGTRALAAGGREACKILGSERRSVLDRMSRLQRLDAGAAVSQPADLPAACRNDDAWSRTDLVELQRQFAALDFASVKQAYSAQRDTVQAKISQSLGTFVKDLETQEGRIFTASDACEKTLGLRTPNTELRALKKKISDARADPNLDRTPELVAIGNEIDAAKNRLATKAATTADQLLGQKQDMDDAGMDTAAFAALATARGKLGSENLTLQALTAVCDAASGADGVLEKWSRNNLPAIWESAKAYRSILARTTNLADASGSACLAASLAALPQRQPAAGDTAWASRTREQLGEAKQCLDDFRDSRAAAITSVQAELTGSVEALSRLEGIEGLPQDRLRRMREELEASLSGLTRAQGVLGLSTESPGVDATEDSLAFLGGLQEVDKQAGLRAVREEATAALVDNAVETAQRWSAKIGKLGTFAALDTALNRFASGDLDHAILDLRNWSPGPGLDAETAALRHATLAFLLHTKWSLLPQDKQQQGVGDLLYEDAAREAQAALRDVPELRLPQALNDESFQKFVANFRM